MAFDCVVVGLGNPGPRYERTRHNAGFMLVELLAAAHDIELGRERHGARVGEGRIAGKRCLLAQPQSFMNLSGDPVRRILSFTGVEPASLLVAHDDLDLPLGRLRLRRGGGAGGHRGIASILEHLGDPSFARLKIGVSRPPVGVPAEAYVLQEFAAGERETLREVLARAAAALEVYLSRGMEAAMNACNPAGAASPP
jgi:peptidyl-tRNA hydrolase, PTH1 family